MSPLPRLTGPRVALVPVDRALAHGVLDGDPAPALTALRLTAGRGWPHADTADGLRPLAEDPAAVDGGWLVVVDGEVVGDAGWRGGPGPTGDVVLGYGLAAPYRGHGLGTEAVAVLCAWADVQPGVRRLVADVRTGNEPSRRLLQRLGFTEVEDLPPWVRCVRAVGGDAPLRGRHVC